MLLQNQTSEGTALSSSLEWKVERTSNKTNPYLVQNIQKLWCYSCTWCGMTSSDMTDCNPERCPAHREGHETAVVKPQPWATVNGHVFSVTQLFVMSRLALRASPDCAWTHRGSMWSVLALTTSGPSDLILWEMYLRLSRHAGKI